MPRVNNAINNSFILSKEIILELKEKGMIKTIRDNPDGWILFSGKWSPLYIQLRALSSYPDLLKKIGNVMGLLIKEKFPAANRVIGVAMAGIPISVAVSLENGIPGSYTRKLEGVKSVEELNDRIKSYGEHSLIEGEIFEGDHIVVVDDLVTGFGSKEIAIEQIQREIERRKLKGIRILGVAVIIDREQGARQAALKKQIQLEALIPFKSRGVDWLKGVMSTGEIEIISQYLEDPEKFQKGNFRDYVKNQMS